VLGASHYRVYRSTSPDLATAQGLGPWQTSAAYEDHAAELGVTYHYWVQAAVSSSGDRASDFTEAVSGYRGLPGVTAVQVSTSEVNEVVLVWEETPGARVYRVYRGTSSDLSQAEPLADWQSAAEYADRTAVPGVTYHYWVQAAADLQGENTSILGLSFSGYRALVPPAGLGVSEGDLDKVAVRWGAVPEASHYRVYRSTSSDPARAEPLGSWQFETMYEDRSAIPGVTYHYWVRAATSDLGDKPSEFSRFGQGYRGIVAPQEILASTGDPERIGIFWNAVEGANYYQVYRTPDIDSVPIEEVSDWQPDTFFEDSSAVPGVMYHYWVRASSRSSGELGSGFSVSATGYRGMRAPADLQVSSGKPEGVEVSWSAASGASYYRVYRSTSDDGVDAEPLSPWQVATAYVDTTADPGVMYHYWVRAGGDSVGSRISGLSERSSGYRAIPAPGGLTASTGDLARISITWSRVDSADFYQVSRATTLDSTVAEALSDWQSDTAFEDSLVVPGITYYYWVRTSRNSSGTLVSGFSTAAGGYRGLSVPSSLEVSKGDTEKVALSWMAVLGASYYRVYRSASADTAGVQLLENWQPDIGYTDTTAVPGITYHYWVRAGVDSVGSRISGLSEGSSGYRAIPAPGGLTALTGDPDGPTLNWGSVSGASHYRVYRHIQDDSLSAQVLGTRWLTNTSYVDSTAEYGVTYYYWVQAAVDSVEGNASILSVPVRGYGALSAPPNLRVLPEGNQILLTWDANPEFDILYYRIYAGAAVDSTTLIDSVLALPSPHLSINSILPLPQQFDLMDMGLTLFSNEDEIRVRFRELVGRDPSNAEVNDLYAVKRLDRGVVAPLDQDLTYHFQVAAVNDDRSEGDYASGRVLSVSEVTPQVGGGSDGAIDISWNSVWGMSHYRLYRHTRREPEAATAISGWQTQTSFRDAGAVTGIVYYYWIRAANSSSGAEATGFSPGGEGFRRPSAPAVVAASNNLPDRVKISWQKVEDASVYRVYHHVNSDTAAAVPISDWLSETSFEDLKAIPGNNYYWVRTATKVTGGHTSRLSALSTGVRTAPLAAPVDIKASWGGFKDRVVITWKNEPAATYSRVYRHRSDDMSAAVAISDWVKTGGFEDRSVAPDATYYYWVRGATSATGRHASGFSPVVSGFRSGPVLTPGGLQATPGSGQVVLSWNPNEEDDLLRYRIYAGTRPDSLALVDSVAAGVEPATTIRDIIPLPRYFNVLDMGLSVLSTREEIAARFSEIFGRPAGTPELDTLFGGQRLDKASVAALEAGRLYYFGVEALDHSLRESRLSALAAVTVTEAAGKPLPELGGALPLHTRLLPNAPNPFNAATRLRFELDAGQRVSIRIYNAVGQLVRTALEEDLLPGRHAVLWDGRDERGDEVGSGIYIYTLEVKGKIESRRMLLLR